MWPLEMAPFERSRTSSYWCCIVTMTLSCIISEIKRENRLKSQFFLTPCIARHGWGGPCRNFDTTFSLENYGVAIPDGEKVYFSRFGTTPACDGQTDRQTSCDSIVRAMYSIER